MTLMDLNKTQTSTEIAARLRTHGINPTSQRIEIAQALFLRCEHLSAEEVFALVNGESARVSKATVYNTLGLFAARGLIREVIADPARIFYDPNTAPHHHNPRPRHRSRAGSERVVGFRNYQRRTAAELPQHERRRTRGETGVTRQLLADQRGAKIFGWHVERVGVVNELR